MESTGKRADTVIVTYVTDSYQSFRGDHIIETKMLNHCAVPPKPTFLLVPPEQWLPICHPPWVSVALLIIKRKEGSGKNAELWSLGTWLPRSDLPSGHLVFVSLHVLIHGWPHTGAVRIYRYAWCNSAFFIVKESFLLPHLLLRSEGVSQGHIQMTSGRGPWLV